VEKCGRAGQATDGNKIRRMRTACWIPKAKIIHSECVILTAFPSQQRLGERASMLRYTYIACLVLIANGQEDICNWYNVCILCTVRDIKLLIYITTFTCTEIHTHQTLVYLLHVSARHTGCVSESGDFATLFLGVRQHWGGCRYRRFAANFKAFSLQWSRGLEHNVLLL